MKLFAAMTAFFCFAIIGHGQIILQPTSSRPLPLASSYLVGLIVNEGAVGLFTADEFYFTDDNAASGWNKAGGLGPYIRVYSPSVFAANPVLAPSHMAFTALLEGELVLADFDRATLSLKTVPLTPPFGVFPRGLAYASDGRAFLSDGTGIHVFTGSALTGSFNAPGELALGSQGAQLVFGADDVLYALDSVNGRVLRFSAEGDFLGAYSVAASYSPATGAGAFGVSASGHLFLSPANADGPSVGYIYAADTGEEIGQFELPDDTAIPGGGTGRNLLTVSGDQLLVINQNGYYLHSYDISGLSTIPEPTTYGLLLGAAVLLAALRKRRK